MLGEPEWGHLEVFATVAQRTEAMDALDHFVREALGSFECTEFLARCHEHGVAAARINTAEDLLAWGHLRERNYFQPVHIEDDRYHVDVPVPSPPWRLHRTVALERGPSPRLPAIGSTVVPWPSTQTTAASSEILVDNHAPVPGPLAGLRVVDLTWVWAGPYAAMQFAHLGADVIKIESSVRLDVTRVLGPWADGEPGPDRSGYYNQYNQGKQGVLLDLKQPRGRELLRALLKDADVVIDNMRAGALAKMGFDYDTLSALNPRIVAVSMSGFGESGPERDRMAYGSLIDALSGVASSNGPPGGGPTDFTMSLPDPCAGIHAVIATLAALFRAQTTGRGDLVECSMLEASVSAFPWSVLYGGVEGRPPPVQGNRDDRRAPHDVYRCLGTYEWVAIAVEDDGQFAALAAAIGRPELARHPRFATPAARRLHADELDGLLTGFTSTRDAHDVAALLHAAGVPAERVAHMNDVAESARLAARNFFTMHEHAVVGVRRLAGAPWLASRSPMVAASAAPSLGQHTRAVLSRCLGLDEATLDDLEAGGVLR